MLSRASASLRRCRVLTRGLATVFRPFSSKTKFSRSDTYGSVTAGVSAGSTSLHRHSIHSNSSLTHVTNSHPSILSAAASPNLSEFQYAVFLSHTGRHDTDHVDPMNDEKQPPPSSHSQSPKVEFAYPLAVMLCVLGDFQHYELFLDFLSLRGPLKFHEYIPSALRGTRVFVAVLSSEFTQSKWCRRETEIFTQLCGQQAPDTNTRSMLPLFWQVRPTDVQGGPVFDSMSPEEKAAFRALCDANGVLTHFGESARDYLVGNIATLLHNLHQSLPRDSRRVFNDHAVALTSADRSDEWRHVAGFVYDAAVEQIQGIGGHLVPEAEFRNLVLRLRDHVRAVAQHRAELTVKTYNLPSPMPNFVGRQELVDRLERRLASMEAMLTVISGMPGVGKTMLANLLVHRLQSSTQSLCAWFPAEKPEAIVGHYRTLGESMGWAEEKDGDDVVLTKFQAWCASHSGWLLVYDNAEDVEAVRALLPTSSQGRVLVTSRQRDWEHHVDASGVVDVEVMEPDDAVDLLTKMSTKEHHTASADLVRELGYLPLAIVHMAALIKNDPSMSVEQALSDFRNEELAEWFLEEAKGRPDLQTIAKVWQSSFSAIDKEFAASGRTSFVRAFMYYSAYFAADNIPRSGLERWAESLPEQKFSGRLIVRQLLGTLQRYSLITLSDDSYSIHRLLQAVLRMEFEAASAEDVADVPGLSVPFGPAFVSRLVRTVKYDFWRETEDVPADEARKRAWSSHMLELWALVDKHLGGSMDQAAFYVLASEVAGHATRIELCQKALLIYGRLLAPGRDVGHGKDGDDGHDEQHKERDGAVRGDHQDRDLVVDDEGEVDDRVDRVRAYRMLLWAYGNAGRLTEAGALVAEARQLLERAAVDVAGRAEAAELWQSIGSVADDRGHYDDAMEAYGKSLDVLSNLESSDSVHNQMRRADVSNCMAVVHRSRGEYDEALSLYGEALAMYKAVYGENVPHPSVATTLNNMANVHYSRGDYDEALRLFGQALAMFKAVYGENVPHPSVASTLNNMGLVHRSRGEYDEAMRLYGEALAMYNTVYGEDVPHPSVANTLNRMGNVHYSQGKYNQALRLYGEALAMYKALYGENVPHPSVANTLGNMGNVHGSRGKFDEALHLYGEALAMKKAVHGENVPHPSVADTLNIMAVVHESRGEHDEALCLYGEALAMYKAVHGENVPHPEVARMLISAALVLSKLGRHQASTLHCAQAAQMCRVMFGVEHPYTTATIDGATDALAAAGYSQTDVDALHKALVNGEPFPVHLLPDDAAEVRGDVDKKY